MPGLAAAEGHTRRLATFNVPGRHRYAKRPMHKAAERQEIESKLTTFTPPQHDWKALFAERSAYEGDLARHHIKVQLYADWLVERQMKGFRDGAGQSIPATEWLS